MPGRLSPVHAVLHPVLAALTPVEVEGVPASAADGLVLAAPIRVAHSMPHEATALRGGLAVASQSVSGAAPHAPVMLSVRPEPVRTGDTLPAGCDAILDPACVVAAGPLFEITDCPAPGTFVRLAGHDVRAGTVLAPANCRMTPALVLACQMADITSVSIRRPRVFLGLGDGAAKTWLAGQLSRLGCALVPRAEAAALVLEDAAAGLPRLALLPGEAGGCFLRQDDRGNPPRAVIAVPSRFDGLLAVYVALVLPVIAALLDQVLDLRPYGLVKKISSVVGVSELALLARYQDKLAPLAVGDIPLSSFVQASHVALVPPESEGLDAGATLDAMALCSPLKAREVSA
jgi:molybdopterin molybdotransferase